MSTPQLSTKQRILHAAEDLFARRGFAGTSMRRVTAAAQVNLAAVNYHFGTKESLVEEVLRRRLDQLNARRLERLQSAVETAEPSLEALLDAFIGPALELAQGQAGGAAFMRVLARAYAEQDERLREFLSANYGHVLKRFAVEFAKLLPQLDKQALYWRLDMIAGALTYAMADFGVTKRKQGTSEKTHKRQAIQHLVRFAAAGLRAQA